MPRLFVIFVLFISCLKANFLGIDLAKIPAQNKATMLRKCASLLSFTSSPTA
ncbi:hypothetical protein [Campylobacter sp. 19-13652]|uniref:hypothetical protein n=1 Tax=Campylobacter sp. 19-13652 TaxID=2840180 RepID=UPI001C859276|nr:hypothetical protein [Campylobacter sp. 19-13652]